jgi:hypothetical protein
MKNRYILFTVLIAVLFYHNQIQAQETLTEKTANQSTYAPTTGFRGEFLGSIIYPGLKLGVERPYKYTQIDKFRKNKIKTLYKERYLSYSLGMYYHNNYHTNIFSQTEWLARRQKSKGFYYESSLGLGLSRTFVDGRTFSVSDDGEVEKIPMSGNWYALASLGGGIGYNAYLTKQKPYSVYLKFHFLFMFPYNAFITPRPTLGLGFNYNFSGIWDATPKFKYKEKQSKKFRKSQNQ